MFNPGKDKSFRTCIVLTVIYQIIIKCGAHAQISKSPFLNISAVSESISINFENIKKKYKESFLIVVSS